MGNELNEFITRERPDNGNGMRG